MQNKSSHHCHDGLLTWHTRHQLEWPQDTNGPQCFKIYASQDLNVRRKGDSNEATRHSEDMFRFGSRASEQDIGYKKRKK